MLKKWDIYRSHHFKNEATCAHIFKKRRAQKFTFFSGFFVKNAQNLGFWALFQKNEAKNGTYVIHIFK